MLSEFLQMFNGKCDLDHAVSLLDSMRDVIELIHKDYLKDGISKEMIIDAIVDILKEELQ